MTNHSLSEFIQQLRKTSFATPLLEQHRFHTTFLKSYAVAENERDGMAANMEKRLSFAGLIENMLFRLESETIPHHKKLSNYIQNLYKIFSGYTKDGSHSDEYFVHILSSLESFQELIRLHTQRTEELMTKLHSLSQGKIKNGSLDFYSEHAGVYVNYWNRYNKKLQQYFDVFNDFLQHEADKKQGLNVITRSEQYLMNLTGMIDHGTYLAGSESNMLNKWKNRLSLAEKQSQSN
jgi:hypothetical protein